MKKFRYIIPLATFIILIGCGKDEVNIQLNPNTDLSFNGTFKTIDSENISGTVTLQISNRYYKSTTNLPYGKGAGKLEVYESTIDFVDTLFFPIPALYGPSYVLSGKHQYKFDGDNLVIWRAKNIGDIEYKLKLIK